jgi:hypothetical protein
MLLNKTIGKPNKNYDTYQSNLPNQNLVVNYYDKILKIKKSFRKSSTRYVQHIGIHTSDSDLQLRKRNKTLAWTRRNSYEKKEICFRVRDTKK